MLYCLLFVIANTWQKVIWGRRCLVCSLWLKGYSPPWWRRHSGGSGWLHYVAHRKGRKCCRVGLRKEISRPITSSSQGPLSVGTKYSNTRSSRNSSHLKYNIPLLAPKGSYLVMENKVNSKFKCSCEHLQPPPILFKILRYLLILKENY